MGLSWTCNSRVDYVDEEMLHLMGKAGCNLISWGIESANEQILKKAAKGYRLEQAPRALRWAHKAGIKNWGYFIIGLPGETVESIKETMRLPKNCRWISHSSTWPRPILARPSSSKCWKITGSGRHAVGAGRYG